MTEESSRVMAELTGLVTFCNTAAVCQALLASLERVIDVADMVGGDSTGPETARAAAVKEAAQKVYRAMNEASRQAKAAALSINQDDDPPEAAE